MGCAFHQLCPRYSGTLTPTAPTAIKLWDTFTFLPYSPKYQTTKFVAAVFKKKLHQSYSMNIGQNSVDPDEAAHYESPHLYHGICI